jgi:deazaflavin-dependent oxidoreductase (nitroreductase family)
MNAWITRVVAPIVYRADGRLLAWSGDRLCLTTALTGMPVTRVTTIGARSGRPRTRPLTAFRDGETLAVIGSNFGRPRLPGWAHNLSVHPGGLLHHPGGARRFISRAASAAEYDLWWRRAVELYPGYAAYARLAAPRRVPIFILTPSVDG